MINRPEGKIIRFPVERTRRPKSEGQPSDPQVLDLDHIYAMLEFLKTLKRNDPRRMIIDHSIKAKYLALVKNYTDEDLIRKVNTSTQEEWQEQPPYWSIFIVSELLLRHILKPKGKDSQ